MLLLRELGALHAGLQLVPGRIEVVDFFDISCGADIVNLIFRNGVVLSLGMKITHHAVLFEIRPLCNLGTDNAVH